MLSFARGAPASTLILLAIVVVGLVTLYGAPSVVERGVFRPYWFTRSTMRRR